VPKSAHTLKSGDSLADKIVKVPDGIELDVAASMMLKGMTAE